MSRSTAYLMLTLLGAPTCVEAPRFTVYDAGTGDTISITSETHGDAGARLGTSGGSTWSSADAALPPSEIGSDDSPNDQANMDAATASDEPKGSSGNEPVSSEPGADAATDTGGQRAVCPPGSFYDGFDCAACPAGTFSAEADTAECTPCGPGAVSREPGSTRCEPAQIAASLYHTCALLESGNVRCWGLGEGGQLGYGNTANIGDTPETTPARIGDVPLGAKAVRVMAGGRTTCALLESGNVRCWGIGIRGNLGYGNSGNVGDTPETTPARIGDVPLGAKAVQVTGGLNHTCALLGSGDVRCWGWNVSGQLGYGSVLSVDEAASMTPERRGDVPLDARAVQVAAGMYHTCALLESGNVRCWGQGVGSQLGYGNIDNVGDTPETTPARIGDVPLGAKAVQVTAGGRHTCALLESGNVRCWGSGGGGRLGYGNSDNVGDTPETTPTRIGDVPLGATAVQVTAGGQHTCALLKSGNVRCWGWNAAGQLGYGNSDNVGDTPETTPERVGDVSLGARAVQVSAGDAHTCALLSSGKLRCWGSGYNGQRGYGDTDYAGRTPDTTLDSIGDAPYY